MNPAQDISLVTLYEVKLALGLTTSTDDTLNDQLELMIKWSSAEVAAMCNRTFAQETVEEKFSELDSSGSNRIFLSHYPVTNIDSVDDGGTLLEEDVGYSLDANSGTLTRLGGVWTDPVSVIYTGGYDLPNDAPIALQQAAMMMTKEAYTASSPSGGAAIRMVAHKESRIMYYDPNKASSSSSSGGSSPARRASADLLKHFMRFWI
jgi:hypothetical protein